MFSEDEVASGLITAMEIQRNNPKRVSVFVGGEFAFGIDADVARQFGLVRGAELSASTCSAVLKADGALRAFDAAIGLLSYRPRTEFEIQHRLGRKGFDDEAVNDAVRRLRERAYLDDFALAREHASSRIDSRGEGLHRIRSDLLRRGVAAEIVDKVVSELQHEVDWTKIAREQADRRWKRLRHTDGERRRRKKLLDYLIRKGFDYSTARRVTAEIEDSSE